MKVAALASVVLAGLLYLISLLLPVGIWFVPAVPGYMYLLIGWIGILAGVVSWYANPLALVAAILLIAGYFKTAFVVSLVALGLALTTLVYSYMKFHVALDAGGTFNTPDMGVYLWIASIAFLSLGALLFTLRASKRKL